MQCQRGHLQSGGPAFGSLVQERKLRALDGHAEVVAKSFVISVVVRQMM